jgi:Kef-type K+ transport system membrane component KefB
MGQPQVVGEMIAGVVLGPSLLGLLAPAAQSLLFPQSSRSALYVCAQLGVGLYMFIVGMEFKREHFKQTARSALVISLSGMLGPIALAVAITPFLLSSAGLFAPSTTHFQALLFMIAATAITAFPMLARIIHENGLSETSIGFLSLSAGAIDDAVAWCLLALVLASFGGNTEAALFTIVGGVALVSMAALVGPRLLSPLERRFEREGMSPGLLASVLIAFLIMASLADKIGLHTVFGGFVLGLIMPRGKLIAPIKKQLEPVTVAMLLPIFFTYSGLNTELSVLKDPRLITTALLILAGSVGAKLGSCWLAARLTGQDNRTALAIGALMNSRGLMELIVINIGLQAGVISRELFSIFVLMAIVTTLIATPLFNRVYGHRMPGSRASVRGIDMEVAANGA